MDYFFTEDQQMIKDLAREIADEKVMPVRAELDEKEEFPWDIMRMLAQSDFMGIYIPEEYGGMGKGGFELALAIEELSRACLGVSTTYAANALGTYPLLLFGSDAQKKKYLPDIASGSKLVAFGLTEANAGSDAAGVQTTAKLEGNEYVLNGTKQWITNGGEAEVYTIIAIARGGACGHGTKEGLRDRKRRRSMRATGFGVVDFLEQQGRGECDD